MTTCNCDVRLCQCPPVGDDTAADLLGLKAAENLVEAMQVFGRTISDVSDRLINIGKQFLQTHERVFGNGLAYDAAITRDGTVIRTRRGHRDAAAPIVTNARRHGKSAAHAALRNGERVITAADLHALTPPPMPSGLKHPTARPPTTLEDAACCTFHYGGVVPQPHTRLAVRSHPHASQGKPRLNRR